ncbi:MAG TPA: hypothetical protein VGP46_01190 [Acidimicrobiales bacterium]|jgi:hypothetical protein|nr:hypothetical protein [Acidimicrobiales bacterium]
MTLLDAHVEAHAVTEPLTRQVRRNIERKAKTARGQIGLNGTTYVGVGGVRCRYCPVPVTDPATAVLANGHVAHTECVERINTLVDQINHDRASERLEAAGLVFAKPNLIVP